MESSAYAGSWMHRKSTGWKRVALVASVAGFVALSVWAASTFVIDAPFLPFWPLVITFVGMFPLHIRTVLGLAKGSGRFPFRARPARAPREVFATLAARIPPRLRFASGGFFLLSWLSAATALWNLRHGGPAISHGMFYADSHGVRTPISEGEYHHLQLAEQRVFSSVPAAFYLVAALYSFATRDEA
jgi:hypothetical protein